MIFASPQIGNLAVWVWILLFAFLFAVVRFLQSRDADFWERALQDNLQARGLGLSSIAFGLVVGTLLVYSPLRDALAQKKSILIHIGSVVFPAIFVYGGLVLLMAGKHSHKFVITRHGQTQTYLQLATTMLGAVICLALGLSYKGIFHMLGYAAR